MFCEILIQHGDDTIDRDLLAATINAVTKSSLSDSFETIGPNTMITRIPHDISLEAIKSEVEELGFKVWIISKQDKKGHHKIVYNCPDNNDDDGINRYLKFVNVQQYRRRIPV